jgi:hypothetical protein
VHPEYEIAILRNPHRLSVASREALFRYTLPYTSRAFGEDPVTMPPHRHRSHFEHTLGGDGVLCLLGKVGEAGEAGEAGKVGEGRAAAAAAPLPELFVLAHANFMYVSVDGDGENDGERGGEEPREQGDTVEDGLDGEGGGKAGPAGGLPLLYLNGICCDPLLQGRGLASKLLGASLKELRPSARYVEDETGGGGGG